MKTSANEVDVSMHFNQYGVNKITNRRKYFSVYGKLSRLFYVKLFSIQNTGYLSIFGLISNISNSKKCAAFGYVYYTVNKRKKNREKMYACSCHEKCRVKYLSLDLITLTLMLAITLTLMLRITLTLMLTITLTTIYGYNPDPNVGYNPDIFFMK